MAKVHNLAPWLYEPIENEGILLSRVRQGLVGTDWEGVLVTTSIPDEIPETFAWITFGSGNEISDGYLLWRVDAFTASTSWLDAEKFAAKLRSLLSSPLFPNKPIMSVEAFTAHRRSGVLDEAEKPVFTFSFTLGQLAEFSDI